MTFNNSLTDITNGYRMNGFYAFMGWLQWKHFVFIVDGHWMFRCEAVGIILNSFLKLSRNSARFHFLSYLYTLAVLATGWSYICVKSCSFVVVCQQGFSHCFEYDTPQMLLVGFHTMTSHCYGGEVTDKKICTRQTEEVRWLQFLWCRLETLRRNGVWCGERFRALFTFWPWGLVRCQQDCVLCLLCCSLNMSTLFTETHQSNVCWILAQRSN